MKRITALLLIIAAPALSAACAFESRTTLTAPSGLPISTGGNGTSGDLLGLWASQSNVTIPTIETCQDFSWEITSQTETSIAGTFAAQCGSSLGISGSATGNLLDPTTVSLSVSGAALVGGLPLCPFSISATGTITNNDTLTIPYSGDTCLGPVHGTETLRRKKADEPAPDPTPEPTPDPDPPPSGGGNPYHVPPGDLSYARAQEVVFATSNEFSGLRAPRGSESEARGAAQELLLRIIWHLHLIGFDAGRQKNPSGAISDDKLTIYINGSWRAFDVFIDLGATNQWLEPAFTEVGGADYQPNGGIPD
jgi:hypothetical protein